MIIVAGATEDSLRIPGFKGWSVDIQADDILDRNGIAQTERLIRPHIRRTPVIEVDAADFGLAAASLSFKVDSQTC